MGTYVGAFENEQAEHTRVRLSELAQHDDI